MRDRLCVTHSAKVQGKHDEVGVIPSLLGVVGKQMHVCSTRTHGRLVIVLSAVKKKSVYSLEMDAWLSCSPCQPFLLPLCAGLRV